MQNMVPIMVFAIGSVGYYILNHHSFLRNFKPYGGFANIVTFLRMAMTFLVGFTFGSLHPFFVLGIFIGILILDGIDGYLARKYNTGSPFGETFDIETDALFTLMLCGVLYLAGYMPWWIMFSGILRYGYVLLEYLLGTSKKKSPTHKHARILSIVVFSTYLTPFVFPYIVYFPSIVIGTAVLFFSFGYSLFMKFQTT